MMAVSPALCLVLVVALYSPHLSASQFLDYYRRPATQSLKQTLVDILLSRILEMNLESAEEEISAMNDGEEAEEESDRLTAVTRYVGVAYHLLEGSPDGDFDIGGIDPGIRATRVIFEFTYNRNKSAYVDGPVAVPDQVNYQPQASCTKDSQNNVYSGAKSYQESLNFGVNAGATLSTFQFGLSGAIKKANEETADTKHVFLDQKRICNYGQVRYLTDATGIHRISESFYSRVKRLSRTYNVEEYMGFLTDWGTHMIVRADVGTKNITRYSYSYLSLFQQVKQEKSGGFKLGGEYTGNGGRLELDISAVRLNSKNNTSFGSRVTSFLIGTDKEPYPVTLTLWHISEALKPEFWTSLPEEGMSYDSLGIAQKRQNLKKALADYADYRGAQQLKDPDVTIPLNWPNGRYALPAAKDGCPQHWSEGYRTQSTGDTYDWSSGITNRIDVKFNGDTITSRYCVKTKIEKDLGYGFDWPEGSYCIARREGSCPPMTPSFGGNPAPRSSFQQGNITWDDKKSCILRNNNNKKWGRLPDGKFDKNTVIDFCCRSDGRSSTPMMLPINQPFVLYRYGGRCQAVNGTTVQEDFVQFDSQSCVYSKNKCAGAHPDLEGTCGKVEDHKIYLCYYSKASV